jgi:hypothetical protein
MNVALTFIEQEIKNAVVVPSVAVLTKNGQEGVLISDHKNKPKFQPVTIGFVKLLRIYFFLPKSLMERTLGYEVSDLAA